MRIVLIMLAAAVAVLPDDQRPERPGPRARHHLVYAPASSEVILIGGARPATASEDRAIWTWDGRRWRAQASTLPRLANEAVGYDVDRGRLVVHGGSDRPDETWEWDHRQWSRAAATGPGPRGHHQLTYDAARKLLVLFGNNDHTPSTDTWAWNGQQWRALAAAGPPPRGVFAMTYDSRRQVLVMFGGCCVPGVGMLGDTWEWDGQRWATVHSATAPTPRFDTHMTYDPERDRIVLFGGRDRGSNLGDTWEFDGRGWSKLDVPGPSARNGHAMVFDPGAKAILLFGGRNDAGYLDDFWAFDGTWRRIQQSAAAHVPDAAPR
jgi:hypothetical protein